MGSSGEWGHGARIKSGWRSSPSNSEAEVRLSEALAITGVH